MRIALVSDFFFPIVGGIATHIEDLANMLLKRGHDVYVIAKKGKYDDSRFKFNVVRIDTVFKNYGPLDVPKLGELRDVIKEIDPDVVHAHHLFSPLSIISLKVGRDIGAKTVITNHSIQVFYDIDYFWKPTSYLLVPHKYYLEYADEIIAVSNAAKEFAQKFIERDDIHVIPNGIFVNDFKPKKKEFKGKNVLFVGRLVHRKGVTTAISAIKKVKKDVKDVKLTIVGKGFMEYFGRILRISYNLRRNVIFLNNIDSRKDLIKIYQNSDVFLCPSLYGESFGIVILEAMASMTPPIASYQGGIKEIIDHKVDGFLFPRGNSKKLAKYITEILENEKLFRKISKNALKKARNYDWTRVSRQIEKVYKS